jgi:hypothetical protein
VHRGPRWRLLCLLGLAVLLALATGLGPCRYAFALPVVQTVPPYRFVGPACALMSLLAALGCEALLRNMRAWWVRGIAALALAGAAGCIWFASCVAAGPGARAVEERWLQEITDHYRELAPEFDPNLLPAQVTPEMVRAFRFTGERTEDGVVVQTDRLSLGRERLHVNLVRAAWMLGIGAVLLLAVSLWSLTRTQVPWLVLIMLLFTVLELGWSGLRLNHGTTRKQRPRSPALEFLVQQRAAAAAEGGFMVARASTKGDVWHMPPGTLSAEGIRDLHFYTFVDAWSSEPFRRLYGDGFMIRDYLPSGLLDDKRLELPFFDLMGLRFLLATEPLEYGGNLVGPELRGPGGKEFRIYERSNAMPRAWTVPALRVLEDDDAMTAAALAVDLDPRAAALTTKLEAAHLEQVPPAPAGSTQRSIRFVRDETRRVTLEVGGGAACYLVLADTMLPGWRAYVDGGPAALARCNVYQRVVALPAAPCTVEFTYFTPGLVQGFAVSSASVLGCFLLLLMGMRHRPVAALRAHVVTGTR